MFKIPKAAQIVASLILVSPTFAQPSVGHSFHVSTSGIILATDAAYSISSSEYLVVWLRHANSRKQILAQRVSWTGALLGPVRNITTNSSTKSRPTVAYVHKTKRWLVVWPEVSGARVVLKGRSVAPATGLMSATSTLVSSASTSHLEPSLGGDRTSVDDDAVLVWRENGGGIRASRVQVPANAAPFRWSTHVVSTNSFDTTPTVSASGGDARRYAVVWKRSKFGSDDIYARALEATGRPLGGTVNVQVSRQDDEDPQIDGDGEQFLAVWKRRETANPLFTDIYARKLRFDGSKLILDGSTLSIAAKAKQDERDPSVAFLGQKFAVAYSPDSGSINKHSITIQMFAAADACACGTSLNMNYENHEDWQPVLAAAYAGASNSDIGLLTYVSEDTSESLIRAIRVKASGSGASFTNMGGGCGPGGALHSLRPFVLGSEFRLALTGASHSSSLAILNIAAQGPPLLSCGPCDISNPTILLPLTLSSGVGSVTMPIPCKNQFFGAQLEFQAYVMGSGSTPCAGLDGLSFSNIVRGYISQ